MRFVATPIPGVLEVHVDWHRDERGDFGRTFCARTFAEHGLNLAVSQCNLSTNRCAGTVRGFHLQAQPYQEVKLVQCVAGHVLDVAVDLRPGSPTFGRHVAVELTSAAGVLLLIPEGCAHGFQTLTQDSAILYYLSMHYVPTAGRGVRWNDPAIGVVWPLPDAIVSERDRNLPLLADYEAA